MYVAHDQTLFAMCWSAADLHSSWGAGDHAEAALAALGSRVAQWIEVAVAKNARGCRCVRDCTHKWYSLSEVLKIQLWRIALSIASKVNWVVTHGLAESRGEIELRETILRRGDNLSSDRQVGEVVTA
jgi:hypothetical protein